MRVTATIILSIALSASAESKHPFVEWHSTGGHVTNAKFVAVKGEMVTLNQGEKTIDVPLSKLDAMSKGMVKYAVLSDRDSKQLTPEQIEVLTRYRSSEDARLNKSGIDYLIGSKLTKDGTLRLMLTPDFNEKPEQLRRHILNATSAGWQEAMLPFGVNPNVELVVDEEVVASVSVFSDADHPTVEWRSTGGHVTNANFVAVQGDSVTLNQGEKTIDVPLSKLDATSKGMVKYAAFSSRRESKPVTPEQFKVLSQIQSASEASMLESKATDMTSSKVLADGTLQLTMNAAFNKKSDIAKRIILQIVYSGWFEATLPIGVSPNVEIVADGRVVYSVSTHVDSKQPTVAGRSQPPEVDGTQPPVITEDEFLKLKAGMSRDEVESIIGESGKTIMPELVGTALYSLTWTNRDGTGMAAIFRDQKLLRADFSNASGETMHKVRP